MKSEALAGTAPAEDRDVIEDAAVPAVSMLRAELIRAQAILADCAALAGDRDQPAGARTNAAAAAAKLMNASAQAAAAIAKLADAESRQRLTGARIDGFFDRPQRRKPESARHAPLQHVPPHVEDDHPFAHIIRDMRASADKKPANNPVTERET